MAAVIYNIDNGVIIRYFPTLKGAKIALTRMRNQGNTDPIMAVSKEDYEKEGAPIANELVTVKNLITGEDIQIRRADVGTCLDPSTERYWSM